MESKLTVTEGEGEGRDKLRIWDQQTHTAIYKLDKQQRPTGQHRKLFSISCNNLLWKESEKNIYMYKTGYIYISCYIYTPCRPAGETAPDSGCNGVIPVSRSPVSVEFMGLWVILRPFGLS